MFLPENIKELIEKLYNSGYEAYAVGGCVRDSILGLSADDYDITTSAVPEQIKDVFSDKTIIETGIKHGTVTVIAGGSPVEITTYRIDGKYSDSRHPEEVEFTSSLTEDLKRRDFTVNAIAYSHITGFKDPFNGLDDINSKTLRCIGNAESSFNDDALRILRAIRFSSVLGFDIAEDTACAVHKCKDNLSKLSYERIQKELFKILRGKNVLDVLLSYSDVIFTLIPELKQEYRHTQYGKKHAYDVWEHTCHTVDNIDSQDEYLRIVMLFHDIGKVPVETINKNGDSDFTGHAKKGAEITEEILRRMNYPSKTLKTVTLLVENHDKKIPQKKNEIKRMINSLGEENFLRFLKIRKADRGALAEPYRDISEEINTALSLYSEIKTNKECTDISTLCINGNEIMEELKTNGEDTGKMLSAALDAVFDEKCDNTKESILAYLKTI